MLRRRALGGALVGLAALLLSAGADAGRSGAAADGGPPAVDAGRAESADAAPPPPCARERARLERRKAWLAARRQEQFEKGGLPDPSRGIPNMVGVYCEAHPSDEECDLGSISISVSPDELLARPDATPEDYEPHVILMKRELDGCRADAGLE